MNLRGEFNEKDLLVSFIQITVYRQREAGKQIGTMTHRNLCSSKFGSRVRNVALSIAFKIFIFYEFIDDCMGDTSTCCVISLALEFFARCNTRSTCSGSTTAAEAGRVGAALTTAVEALWVGETLTTAAEAGQVGAALTTAAEAGWVVGECVPSLGGVAPTGVDAEVGVVN